MASRRAVRKPLSVREHSRRAPEEHMVARFPRLFSLLARSVARLPPESRIRQAMIWRATEQALAATNRRDFAAVLPRYDPEVEFFPARELASVGIAASYRGRDGYLSLWEDWDSAWAGHAQWEPRELIDLGDRLLMLGKMSGTGDASRIAVDTEIAVLWTLENGKVIREEQFLDPAEVLEAVGLRPSAGRAAPLT
jgi:ketosteroid isomerase-like protein